MTPAFNLSFVPVSAYHAERLARAAVARINEQERVVQAKSDAIKQQEYAKYLDGYDGRFFRLGPYTIDFWEFKFYGSKSKPVPWTIEEFAKEWRSGDWGFDRAPWHDWKKIGIVHKRIRDLALRVLKATVISDTVNLSLEDFDTLSSWGVPLE